MWYYINMQTPANRVDLHAHSTYSDGSYTPREILEAAIGAGLSAVAITDHDTVDGIGEALCAAKSLIDKVSLIPGVEISASYPRQLHILGYFHPDRYIKIDAFLKNMKYERDQRNIGILQKLNGYGIRISADEVAGIAGKEIFGRPHIAAALVKKGIVSSISAAFLEYLGDGRKAYVGKKSLPPHECVQAIADAGGLAVIAHPSLTGMKLSELESLARSLIEYGLFGIEAYYPEHAEALTQNYAALAGRLGLASTGGSDFHGEYRKHIRLGTGKEGNLHVPDDVPGIIMKRLDSNCH